MGESQWALDLETDLCVIDIIGFLSSLGVIHRDIKGANILCTKEGIVKLADFGVATKLSDSRKSDSVVGTPYWSISMCFVLIWYDWCSDDCILCVVMERVEDCPIFNSNSTFIL